MIKKKRVVRDIYACQEMIHRANNLIGIFLDSPTRRGAELNGNHEVWNFTHYMFDNPNAVFIVFQGYNCSRDPGARRRHERSRKFRPESADFRGVLPDEQRIQIISSTLVSALIEAGNCSPFDDDSNYEMKAPFSFIYHHRTQLRELGQRKQGEASLQISSLLSYVESNHQEEYDDADAKFAKGVVTLQHLQKLWLPNQLVITHVKGHAVARVLGTWPELSKSAKGAQNALSLRLWSWEYDGNNLNRVYNTEDIGLANYDEFAIDQLSTYPIKFASQELQDQLKARGQKYWSLRRQHLVSYSGLDFNRETIYVIHIPTRHSESLVLMIFIETKQVRCGH